jgi:hypothetical protein
MTEYEKLNKVFEEILQEDDRMGLDPRVIASKLVGKNKGISTADTESRNIFINEFISQGLNALQSAVSSGMLTGQPGQVSKFMTDWFNTYLRGSRVNSNMAPEQVKAVADRIEQAYKSESKGSLFRKEGSAGKKTKEEVARLGHLGWGLYHTRSSQPNNTATITNPSNNPNDPTTRGGQPAPGTNDYVPDNRIDIGNLRQGVQNVVAMINRFDQTTKRRAVSAILQGTNMLANVDQIVDAIAADRLTKSELETLLRAAQNKLGNENPAQGDLLAVGANDARFPQAQGTRASVTPIGQGRQRPR